MAETRGASDGPKPEEGARKGVFSWLDTGLNVVEQGVLIVGILLMAAVTIANVIFRNLGESLSFADELAQILVVIVTFVGVGHGVRNARHIRVSALHDLLPETGQKVLLTIVSFTSSALIALLAVYAIDYVSNLKTSGRVMPSLQFPLWIPYLIVPVGLIIGAAQFFLAGIRNLISPGAWLSWHNPDEYEDDLDEIAAETGMPSDMAHFDEDDDKPADKEKSNG